jgi:hypothetical protein
VNTPWTKLASAFVAAALFASCGAADGADGDAENADVDTESVVTINEALGENFQSLMSCTNPDGTNSVMAALAVATAQELKRWQPTKDFVVFGATGGMSGTNGFSETTPGPQQAIKLTPTGKARCADGKCATVQALLDLQYDQANNKVKLPGNVTLSPAALRSRLVAKLREQNTCDSRPANGGNNCPVEEHTLTFQKALKGSCDTNFFFQASGTTGAPLKFPAQLKNKLIWVDNTNPYVAFQSSGSVVSIDPTYGLNEDTGSTAGTCSAACARITASNVTGQCCACGGASKKFARAPWNANTYLCQ